MAIANRVFIGSSTEALRITKAITKVLRRKFVVVPWTADVFHPGSYTIEGLLKEVERCDFALFVFAPDDISVIRKKRYSTARDNVIFELGLFMARLGRERCFFLLPKRVADFKIPSDLSGITPLTYAFTRITTRVKTSILPAAREFERHVKRSTFGDGTVVSLSGKWRQVWNVKSTNYPASNKSIADVRQIGNRFDAICEVDGRPFVVKGEIQGGNMLTGTWADREQGPAYFGAFQFRIHPKCRSMSGKWIGFSESGEIKSGDWHWTKISSRK